MEFSLNLAWFLLAALMFVRWLLLPVRTRADRCMQFIALAVLLLILFPVISVTDDLQAVQNAAETDCCQRRVQACSCPHSILPAVAALPLPAFSAAAFGVVRLAAPGRLEAPVFERPALAPIQSQPPPAA
jgi:hypothetical protein